MARKKRLAVALAALGCLQAGSVWALGLGELSLNSFLNEPLRAEVGLLDVGNLDQDQIRVRLATADDFDRLGIDRAYFLTGISFEVRVDKNGGGAIILTSEDPVLEPYLDFIVEARWPSGRLLRNYTVLVDPPAFESQGTTVSASRLVAEAEASAEVPAETVDSSGEGTRVGMRESELAPGAMPERNFSAGTASDPAPGARYMIRRDETLWTIAQRARPEGVTVQQAMLEIQRLNPDAFIDGNINRIKAGYIIYLPDSSDVAGDADVAAVLAEVRQQNEDWRAGRASAPASAGPALRISAGAASEQGDTDTRADAVPDSTSATEVASAAAEDAMAPATDSADDARARAAFGEQLTQLTDRLDALERMVEVKDAEIAALQQALAEAEATPGSALPADDVAADTAVVPVVAPAPAVVVQPESPAPQAGSNSYWLYVAGGAVLALLAGLFVWRRRQEDDTGEEALAVVPAARAPRQKEADAFADIQLQDHAVEFDEDESSESATATPSDAAPVDTGMQRGGQRGYGERKHDEYASDVDAGDALAEADIYIAYGRYAQAMDLLRKATLSDPDNPAYRLKLLGLAAETGDRDQADQQMMELQRIGDATSIARAEQILSDARLSPVDERIDAQDDFSSSAPGEAFNDGGFLSDLDEGSVPPATPARAPASYAPVDDLSGDLPEFEELSSLDGRDALVPSVDEEPEFLDLEIEDGSADELDLSADFEKARSGGDSSEDDFVFADDGDPMSNKLDLARAYIDMGDDDGARQILDEVILGGSSEQQQDARELLERLG